MIILSGKEVFRLAVDRTPQQTKPTKEGVAPRTYYRAKYDGIGFTIDQPTLDALNAGTVVEITLSEGVRKVADPLAVGQFKDVKSLAFNSFATKDQLITAATFTKEIAEIESPRLDAITLNDDQFAKLQLAMSSSAKA